ncbi:hypothetical protein [Ancylobacter oerskovii]|uniref:Mobilization protein MobC n=1 Tax=Ancylobacter oerskovii TaxID=459519 RepID=A0ABW4Z5P1_9HYPH|nr:hypothetical protein [Ancylobacter oerskovii]MBS7545564.1 hypothetical protein [Ancylobacter oerskovii]
MEAQLQARVAKSTEEAFAALAASLLKTPGEVLRQIVLRVLQGEGAPSDAAAQIAPGAKTGRLKALVPAEVKVAWTKRAKQHGMTASEMLRAAVTAVLAANPAVRPPPPEGPGDEVDDPKRKLTLMLYQRELDAIDRSAQRLGWRKTTWAIGVLRNALSNEPRPTDSELATLKRSNSELLAIGRNLNQLAHALHRDDRYKDSVTVEKLDALRSHINNHVSHVQALLEAVQNRWEPSPIEDAG